MLAVTLYATQLIICYTINVISRSASNAVRLASQSRAWNSNELPVNRTRRHIFTLVDLNFGIDALRSR